MTPANAKVEEDIPADLRGTRAQAMQRLQVGIGGLAAMVLVVGLASTIMQQARQADDPARPEAAEQVKEKAGDPLVDAGVVPELQTEEVVVPDLPVENVVTEEPPTGTGSGNDASPPSEED